MGKKINFIKNKTIYARELNNNFDNFIFNNLNFYENSKNLVKASIDANTAGLVKILVKVVINKHKFINKIKKLKIEKNYISNRSNYIKFFNFYKNYGRIFAANEYNIVYLKNNNLNKISILKKKTIHFNLNLVKSQIFLSLNKNFKSYVFWTMSLGSLIKSLRLNKNYRRTKIGLDYLLKFLNKKIKKLMKLNYFFIVTCRGHKKIASILVEWLLNLIPRKRMLSLVWLPAIPMTYQKKKRYASIKKNMKKRLLKIKNFY